MSIYERSEDHAVCKVCGRIDCHECKPNKENKVMISTKLAGVTKNDTCNKNIQKLKEGQVLDLLSYRFAKRSYVDEFAVGVVFHQDENLPKRSAETILKEDICGHIPARMGMNKRFHNNATTTCTVTNVMRKAGKKTDKDFDEGGFTNDTSVPVVAIQIEADLVEISAPAPVALMGKPNEPFELKKSFNEQGVEVEFYPIAHEYWIGDTEFMSVTRLKKTMYTEFDDSIANNCVKSWGLPAQDIKDMWNLNGDCASGVGTGLHGWMEIYQRYGLNMPEAKRIKSLPKIGMFREIVLSFAWDNNVVHTEVLVTDVERGLCGHVDRAVETADGIRIGDYKFNAEWDVKKSEHKNLRFPDLPNTKVSGYLVQESIYADMIEKSGMKVAPTVIAHIWDGQWHHEEMGRIHGIVDMIKSKAGA